MIHEHKGLTSTPKFDGKELRGWEMYTLPCENADLAKLKYTPQTGTAASDGPAFLRAKFQSDQQIDTYLDMSQWGKGVIWVNGYNLGRYWNIGPQQALYLPGCWLNKGENEIVVLALDPQKTPTIAGITKQIWETKIDPSLLNRKPGQTLKLDTKDVVKTGRFAQGEAWQTVTFDKPGKARYLCLEALNALDKRDFAAVAELVFLDKAGNDIPREDCSVLYADSEELLSENGSAKLVLDNQPTTWWHTQWGGKNNPKFPHQLVIDLGAEREISGFRYQPRQGSPNGRIGDYRVYLRTEPFAGL
jgi:beta-galactosidase